jgi:GTP-binding protein
VFFSKRAPVLIPKVVIVGRPNVGKSSLFNWLVGQRIAIVDPTAGVTRDRITFLYEFEGRFFEFIDTGGMGVLDKDGLTKDIERQITVALDQADFVLFVVDAQTGMLPLDELVAQRLRGLDKPVVLVANKCDSKSDRMNADAEFRKLGYPMVQTTVAHNEGREDLWTAVLGGLPTETGQASAPIMKLAVVGKRNAGKSTFVNRLAEQERMIVSETPGTTRDSVDVRFEYNGRTFVAIDTAGVQRKRALNESVEFYSYSRAQRTIRRADVVVLFFDATQHVSQVDVHLAEAILEHSKPCVLAVNKWDLLADKTTTGEFSDYLDKTIPMLDFAPRVFLTAMTGKNVQALVDVVWSLFKQANARASTADVNRALQAAVARKQPPVRNNRNLKMFYATQAGVNPPTVVVFCNDVRLVDPQYEKFLRNQLRTSLPFEEIPLRLVFRRRGAGKVEREVEAELDEAGMPKEAEGEAAAQ